jgi:hypothetical protein
MAKSTVLFPGKYAFSCSCGATYQELTVTRKMEVQNWCFFCKTNNAKHIKQMEYQTLEFSDNYNNKLNCKAFTTLRLRNDRKYYPGAKFRIQLKGTYKGTAIVKAVSHFNIDRINDYIAFLDTGSSAQECRQIIKNFYKKSVTINWDRQDIAFILLVFEEKKEMNDLFDGV